MLRALLIHFLPMFLLSCSSSWAQDPSLPGVDDGFTISDTDWPWWRGPQRNGTANSNQQLPAEFGPDKNVKWKLDVPGRGHGSPILLGTSLLLNVADEVTGQQAVWCVHRDSGDVLWKTTVHQSGGMQKNNRSTMASSSPACDGQHVFVTFPNNGQLFVTALNMQGEIQWQKAVSSYVVHQGYGASPALYQNLVIVSADNKGGGAIAAYDRTSGELAWKRERPETPNYPSPILLNVHGKDQIVMVGCDQVVSYDPLTGKTNWSTEGATTECVTSTVTDGNLIYTSGGYPRNHMSAIKADGSCDLVWENKSRLYVPSLVIHNGYLYGVLDAGIATCWKADTGEEMWKARLGGSFSSSPVLVGDKIFVCNEQGKCFTYEATPDAYAPLAENQLGDNVFATPTIAGGRIYHRVGHVDDQGNRHEVLYCIGTN